jgi:hypothetical protein
VHSLSQDLDWSRQNADTCRFVDAPRMRRGCVYWFAALVTRFESALAQHHGLVEDVSASQVGAASFCSGTLTIWTDADYTACSMGQNRAMCLEQQAAGYCKDETRWFRGIPLNGLDAVYLADLDILEGLQ